MLSMTSLSATPTSPAAATPVTTANSTASSLQAVTQRLTNTPTHAAIVPAASAVVVAAPKTTTLDKKKYSAFGEGWGAFSYKIQWQLQGKVPFRTLIVQKVTVTYEIKDIKDQDISNIATYTNNFCLWQNSKPYWEAWIIKSNATRPSYIDGKPSDDAQAKEEDRDGDDIYSNGGISILNPNGTGRQNFVKTKGWVQYEGVATLYRVDSSSPTDSLPDNWLKTYNFIEFQLNTNSVSPAGRLPYTYTDPNPPATAIIGKTQDHNMVAYWDCCGSNPKLKTKIEPDKTYTSAELWNKVNQLVQQYGKIKKKKPKRW